MENLYRKIKADLYRHIVKLDKNYPAYTLFLSVSDGESRAKVTHCSGDSLDKVWAELQEKGLQLSKELTGLPKYLRVDWVRDVRKTNIKQLTEWLTQVKRNYFRYGLAFDVNFKVAFLEQELNANAMLYLGNKIPYVAINRKNFTSYSKRRYPNSDFNIEQAQTVYMLDTQGVFCSVDEGSHLLYPKSREAGRRIKDKLGYNDVLDVIDASSQYLATQVKDQGDFYYGWHPCFDRYINTYNTLRHASTTYSMIEAWEVTKDVKLEQAINRSLSYIVNSLVKKVNVEHETLAFLVEHNGLEVKLGANAVCILALAKYSEITGTDKYLNLLNQLASGIEYMQNKDTGQFVHVLNYPDLSVKDEFRIIYYDGEAAFGLMRLYGLTKNNRWISIVEKAFDYFIKAEHWRAHDHWLSYCVNELTLYRNEEKYYKFGLQNVEGYLDFIANRITTFPTLLELIMAAEKMIVRLKSLGKHNHLLNGFDLEKFYLALEKRAHYVLNGFFWPEYAMYFANPKKIMGGFFIRHHSFRIRIDDVEHYLSGLIAYYKFLTKEKTHD